MVIFMFISLNINDGYYLYITASVVNPRLAQHFNLLRCNKCKMSPGFGVRKVGVESQCSLVGTLHFCSSSSSGSTSYVS